RIDSIARSAENDLRSLRHWRSLRPRAHDLLTIRIADRACTAARWSGRTVMLDSLIGELVVLDMRSTFVCLGTFTRMDQHFLELRDADFHDMRDTETTRELYIADSHRTGVKRNRRRVLLVRAEIVAVSRLADVVDE